MMSWKWQHPFWRRRDSDSAHLLAREAHEGPPGLPSLAWPYRRVVVGSPPLAVAAKTKNEPALRIELDADRPASYRGERAFPTGSDDARAVLIDDNGNRSSWVGFPPAQVRLVRNGGDRLTEEPQNQYLLQVHVRRRIPARCVASPEFAPDIKMRSSGDVRNQRTATWKRKARRADDEYRGGVGRRYCPRPAP